jgi:hypothetical protein
MLPPTGKNNYFKSIIAITTLLSLLSCDRIKNKGGAIVDKSKQAISTTKQKISDKKDKLIDQVIPTYDYNKKDTESNKKRFSEHLKVDLTPDVKNIYTYGDFLGIDYKVLIAFTCEQATINKIVTAKKMKLTTEADDSGLMFGEEFTWWDKEKIDKLTPYKVGKELEYWQYLWYDAKTKQAFYEEFSM